MTDGQELKGHVEPQVNVGRKYKSRKERPWVTSTSYGAGHLLILH